MPNAWFFNPWHPDSNPKIIRKNLETSINKYTFFGLRYPTNIENGPRVPQDAKVKQPSMPNNRLTFQKCQDPLATMPRICNPRALSNGRGPGAVSAAHKISIIYRTTRLINGQAASWSSVVKGRGFSVCYEGQF